MVICPASISTPTSSRVARPSISSGPVQKMPVSQPLIEPAADEDADQRRHDDRPSQHAHLGEMTTRRMVRPRAANACRRSRALPDRVAAGHWALPSRRDLRLVGLAAARARSAGSPACAAAWRQPARCARRQPRRETAQPPRCSSSSRSSPSCACRVAIATSLPPRAPSARHGAPRTSPGAHRHGAKPRPRVSARSASRHGPAECRSCRSHPPRGPTPRRRGRRPPSSDRRSAASWCDGTFPAALLLASFLDIADHVERTFRPVVGLTIEDGATALPACRSA